jgi:hypothetical protein
MPVSALVVLTVACWSGFGQAQLADRESVRLETGRAFQQALDQPFSATWDHVDLATILRRIGETRRIAVVADRRIDPSREISASASGESLREFLDALGQRNSASLRVVGNVAFLGFGNSAGKLRTLVAVRQSELFDDAGKIPPRRQLELTRPATIAWDDLETPSEILAHIARRFEIQVTNPQELPHDLWRGDVFPECSATELLSLVLIQFDRTFEWTEGGTAIRIVPIPEEVGIERRYEPPRGMSPEAALAEWRQSVPGATGVVAGNRIQVRSTVEGHEAIELLRRGGVAAKGGHQNTKLPPLSRERFTLRVKDARVLSLMQRLSQPGNSQMTFVYDAAEFRSAGIDLGSLVSFELENATAEKLLSRMFDPLGVAFELDGRTVTLRPKGR